MNVAELPVAFPVRRTVTLYLAVLLLALVASGLHILHSHSNVTWTVADWLINYRGGFVRRGLFGEVTLRLSEMTGLLPQTVVVLVAMSAYAVLFFAVWQLTRRLRWNYWFLLLLFSPVTMQFPLVSTSSYHKEVLLFAGFAVLLLLLLRGVSSAVLVIYLTVFGAAGVLTHEPFIVYSPYFAAALYLFYRDVRRVLMVLALPALATGLALAAVVTHPGDRATALQVCRSLGEANQWLCQGSIQYLTYSTQDARADAVETAARFGYARFYPPMALFALLPFVGCFLLLRRQSLPIDAQRVLLAAFGLSAMCSTLLFVYATDWGRWIQMHLMLFFLLLLASGIRYASGPEQLSPGNRLSHNSVLATIFLAAYSTCWSMPGSTDIPKWGYLSMAGRVLARAAHKHVF